MIRALTRRRAGLLGALTVPLTLASTLLMPSAAVAEVIDTREVTAGPLNRGVLEITAVSCERTDEPGDFGRLAISGAVLVPPTRDDTVWIRVNDKVTHENVAVLPLDSGATAFSTTIVADGLRPLPPMELVVMQRNPFTGAVSQRDRVVTLGRCGWADFAQLPVPRATSVDFVGLLPSAVISNESAFSLTVNVGFSLCSRAAEVPLCSAEAALTRVVVPPGGTAPAPSPTAVAPGAVLVVETGIVGRDLHSSRYLGQPLAVDIPSV